MKQTFLILMLGCCQHHAWAQFQEKINTGRPGQSIGAFAVGKHMCQVQSGVNYFNNKGPAFAGSGFLTNHIIRFGITESFEVGGLLEYRWEEQTIDNQTLTLQGWSDLEIGMRYTVYKGHGLVPSIGLQLRGRIPGATGDYATDHWAPIFLVVLSQQLSDRLTLITNWGVSWSGNSSTGQGNYTANLSCTITDRLGVFIENYGSLLESDFDTYMNSGLAWLVNDNFQLDLFAGYGANDGVKEFSVSSGLSLRTKRKK